jgi:CRISPR-associated exonuclease Cas4
MDAVQKLLDENSSFSVTGILMQYVEVCEREVWFEYHNINIDRSNPHVVEGTIVDESSYDGLNRKTIRIGPIAPDMLQNGKIVEIKPSQAYEDAKKSQLQYYMWYLKNKYDIKKEGILAYPEQRKRINIVLTKEDEQDVEDRIRRIHKIVSMDNPPELVKKPACESCAYKDFCWVGDTNEK